MHAEEPAQTQYPQPVGENETKESAEWVSRNYPHHPTPVAVDDLSTEDKRILDSVSLYGWVWRIRQRRRYFPSLPYDVPCSCPEEASRAELTIPFAFARSRASTTPNELDHPKKPRPRSGTPWKDTAVCGHL